MGHSKSEQHLTHCNRGGCSSVCPGDAQSNAEQPGGGRDSSPLSLSVVWLGGATAPVRAWGGADRGELRGCRPGPARTKVTSQQGLQGVLS